MKLAFAAMFTLVASAASAQSPSPVVTDAEMKTYLTKQSAPTQPVVTQPNVTQPNLNLTIQQSLELQRQQLELQRQALDVAKQAAADAQLQAILANMQQYSPLLTRRLSCHSYRIGQQFYTSCF